MQQEERQMPIPTKIQLVARLVQALEAVEMHPDVRSSDELRLCTTIHEKINSLEYAMFQEIKQRMTP
jgi:hypothetical protein